MRRDLAKVHESEQSRWFSGQTAQIRTLLVIHNPASRHSFLKSRNETRIRDVWRYSCNSFHFWSFFSPRFVPSLSVHFVDVLQKKSENIFVVYAFSVTCPSWKSPGVVLPGVVERRIEPSKWKREEECGTRSRWAGRGPFKVTLHTACELWRLNAMTKLLKLVNCKWQLWSERAVGHKLWTCPQQWIDNLTILAEYFKSWNNLKKMDIVN